MSEDLISKIMNGTSEYEENISKNIKEYATREELYKLPIETTKKIFKNAGPIDAELAKKVMMHASKEYGDDSISFLQVLNVENLNFEDSCEIASTVPGSTILSSIGKYREYRKEIKDEEAEIFEKEQAAKTEPKQAKTAKREPGKIAESVSIRPTEMSANIIHYVFKDDKDSVEYLLDQDPSLLEKKDECDATPLFFAAQEGNLDIVEMLVERNANIEAKTTISSFFLI